MKVANIKLTVYNYYAEHAFAKSSNQKHNKEFADEAHAKALEYLVEKLN